MSTLWPGIQQMNACSRHALTIIASGYGSRLRLVWHCCNHRWIIHFRTRWLRRERVKRDSNWIAMVWTRRMSPGCRLFSSTSPPLHTSQPPQTTHHLYTFFFRIRVVGSASCTVAMFFFYLLTLVHAHFHYFNITPHKKLITITSCSNTT